MYRTVKTTDKAAASSGHSELYENGSSGDTTEDLMFDIQNSTKPNNDNQPSTHENDYHALWSNSSRYLSS